MRHQVEQFEVCAVLEDDRVIPVPILHDSLHVMKEVLVARVRLRSISCGSQEERYVQRTRMLEHLQRPESDLLGSISKAIE